MKALASPIMALIRSLNRRRCLCALVRRRFTGLVVEEGDG
jgi:hypothetical protein